jgi:threonine dehydrogenase-like Zn-dependent dehydrogenase
VGSPESVETSLRFLNTQGTLAISGVEAPRRFEWTPLYFKEIHVTGSNAFGVEEVHGVRKHAFEHYFRLCAEGFDVTPIITHRFPLDRWRDAYVTIANRRRTGAVKVLLEP